MVSSEAIKRGPGHLRVHSDALQAAVATNAAQHADCCATLTENFATILQFPLLCSHVPLKTWRVIMHMASAALHLISTPGQLPRHATQTIFHSYNCFLSAHSMSGIINTSLTTSLDITTLLAFCHLPICNIIWSSSFYANLCAQ